MSTHDDRRPARGEEYNPGKATSARQAATVILLRGGAQMLEVLLVKRTPAARFMGGVWVFPGGAVDTNEGEGDGAHRAAAIRELREEAAIALDDPDALVKFSRWITPAERSIRARATATRPTARRRSASCARRPRSRSRTPAPS